MHPIAELAKMSVEAYVREEKTIAPPEPLPPEMAVQSGVFVCLKKGGELRGCIGTYLPSCCVDRSGSHHKCHLSCNERPDGSAL